MIQKNEQKVLQHIIANSRTTDSAIAEQIGITTQAVGKIRHKLESEGIIQRYDVELDKHKIGLEIISIFTLECPSAAANEQAFRKRVEQDPHIIFFAKIQHGTAFYALLMAFKDLNESEIYFKQFTQEHPDAIFERMQTSSWNAVWKHSMREAYLHAVKDHQS